MTELPPRTASGMRPADIRRIPLAAMFVALGVVVPQVFHWFGLGSAFLPMFLPVMMGAVLLPRALAATVAVLAPSASWMLTGMPPLSPPILPLLMLELLAAALVASTLRFHLHVPVFLAVLAGLIVDRVILYAAVLLATEALGLRHPAIGPAMVAIGIPGIVLQLIVIPTTVSLLRQRFPQLLAPIHVRGDRP